MLLNDALLKPPASSEEDGINIKTKLKRLRVVTDFKVRKLGKFWKKFRENRLVSKCSKRLFSRWRDYID